MRLQQEADEEKKELGSTLWGCYNALTHWSTHTDYKVERYNQETHKLETISGGRQNANKPNVERQSKEKVKLKPGKTKIEVNPDVPIGQISGGNKASTGNLH